MKVTATEVQKNLGRIQHHMRKSHEPVIVTSHGREVFVLVPAREKARDRRAFYTRELPRKVVEAIARVDMDARHDHLDEELR